MIPTLVSDSDFREGVVDALPGVVDDLLTLLGVLVAVSIALHVAIWSKPISPNDPQAHARAAHQYLFAVVGAVIGVVSALAATVVTIASFVASDKTGLLPAPVAVGACVVSGALCVLAASAMELTRKVIDQLVEHDAKEKHSAVITGAEKMYSTQEGERLRKLGKRSRVLGIVVYALALILVPGGIATCVASLFLRDAEWIIFLLVAASAVAGTVLVYVTSYWLATRDLFGGPAGVIWWSIYLMTVIGVPILVAESRGEVGIWWVSLMAPVVIAIVHQYIGRRYQRLARWSLRPILRAAIEHKLAEKGDSITREEQRLRVG